MSYYTDKPEGSENSWERWLPEEDNELLLADAIGLSVPFMARGLKRTQRSVEQRIAKLKRERVIPDPSDPQATVTISTGPSTEIGFNTLADTPPSGA